jgi:hypothetical protein
MLSAATIVRRRRHNVTLHVRCISRIFKNKFFLIMHLLTRNLEPKYRSQYDDDFLHELSSYHVCAFMV